MVAKFRGEGFAVDYLNTTGNTIAARSIINYGNGILGVVNSDIPAGELGAVYISGMIEIDKETASQTGSVGDFVSIDPAAGNVNLNIVGDHQLLEASADGDTKAMVFLNRMLPMAFKDSALDGYQYHMVSGVIRYSDSDSGWRDLETIEGGAGNHVSLNIASVTNDNDSITVTYDTAKWGANPKVVSACVTADETLAKYGIVPGASVTASAITITLTKQGIADRMSYNGASWDSANGYFTAAWDGANNRVVFTADGTPSRVIVDSMQGNPEPYWPNTQAQLTAWDTPFHVAEEGSGATAGVPFVRAAFYDTTTGVKETAESTDMKCTIYLPGASLILDPAEFEEDLTNIWVFALIRSDKT